MDTGFLYFKKNFLLLFIIIFSAQLKLFNFTTCKTKDDLNSKDCFNDIIKLANKKYTRGYICSNDKNILAIEYSSESSDDSRLFYSLKENGRGVFENEKAIKEITLNSNQYHEGKKIIGRYESINAFVSLESDTKKEKQYLLSISSKISLTELHDIEEGNYQQWITTDFLNINDKNRYIFSLRYSFLELKNTNIYFLVYIQYGSTDSQGKDISKSYTISKFSFKKEKNLIKVNHLNKVEDNSMYNCRIVSGVIVDMYDILAVAYFIEEKSKLMLKFYNYDLSEISSSLVDTILNPGNGQFLKILICKENYIAIIFFMNGNDGSSIKLKFYKINKNALNKFYLEQLDAQYGFGTSLKNDIMLNDFYKINNNRFVFISTVDYTKLFICVIETNDRYTSHKYKDYVFNLESSTNSMKFSKELSLGMYKGFLLLSSTISSNIESNDDYFSYLIFFGYANGTDFTADITPYFGDIDGYDSNNDFVKYLLEHASIDNNIFSYKLIRKVKIISVPKEILIYNKNDLSKPIVDGTIIDEGNYVLHQNKEVIKTNKLYELEYQYLVQEPSSYISNSYENGQILFGRVNKLSMKLCHEFCETCNELGISNNKQYCLSCLEPYTYDYFSYFNIFESNCVPEGYFNDRENNQLIKCNSVEHKYYYNKTDNNKRICFKYDYECPTSYSYFDYISSECSNYIYDLDEDLTETYTTNVISNLTSIINGYVFLDAAQNPKIFKINHSTHSPIDLIDALEKVKKENRKFYEFYREIREIIGSVRDMHFNIFPINSPSGKIFVQVSACIPFSFIVDKDNNDNKIKIYINYLEDCGKFYNDNIKNYIINKMETKTALKLINSQDPFEYIQNWGWKYWGPKSPHGQFSYAKHTIPTFYLNYYPLTPEELKIKYEFESKDDKEDFIILDYYILAPNFGQFKQLYKSDKNLLFSFDQNKFSQFFDKEMKEYINNIKKPNIFQVFKKYLKKNTILKENLKSTKEIKWDYETKEDDGIKCRVDYDNNVNVFLQQSFVMDINDALYIIPECINLFYSNNYPIIGIENQNGGGIIFIAQLFNQLLQVKLQEHMFFSGRSTNLYRQIFESIQSGITDIETCKPFNGADDFMDGIKDEYTDNTKIIIHKRTKTFNFGSKEGINIIHNLRKFFMNNGNLKKPTDIIIFTDGFSFSATSLFIKGFQKTGGAITVGFNGNPQLSDDLFDASQSPTNIQEFKESVYYQNLFELGFYVNSISASESFGDNYMEKNSLPLEYDFDPVDERVDIYNEYSDDIYQTFINKGKEIFKKYNQDKKCNKKNKKLLYDNNDEKTCYKFDDDEHAHGGYQCNDYGTWSDICIPYYCDIGYYFNTYTKKCVKDICAEEIKMQSTINAGNNDIKTSPKNEQAFPIYAIILISIGSVLILLLIITIIIKKWFCKNNINSYKLESLMTLNKEINEIEEIKDI